MENYSLKMILGLPVSVNNEIKYNTPTLKTILGYDYEKLLFGVTAFYDILKVTMGDDKVLDFAVDNNYDDYTLLNLFTIDSEEIRNIILESLKLHFDNIEYKKEKFYICGVLMDREIYNSISELYRESYNLQEKISDRKFPNNETKKKILLLDWKKSKGEHSVKSGSKCSLTKMVSLLSTRLPYDLTTRTIYQLYDSYIRIVKEKNYDATTFGVYSGNVDKKYLKIEDWLE